LRVVALQRSRARCQKILLLFKFLLTAFADGDADFLALQGEAVGACACGAATVAVGLIGSSGAGFAGFGG